MKFNKSHLPKSRTDLEKFVNQHGLHAYGKVEYKGRDIFLAETDLERDKPKVHPWGYFQTAWFVNSTSKENSFDVGSWVEFDAMHDLDEEWTQETKRRARINAAIGQAQDFINKCEEVV